MVKDVTAGPTFTTVVLPSSDLVIIFQELTLSPNSTQLIMAAVDIDELAETDMGGFGPAKEYLLRVS